MFRRVFAILLVAVLPARAIAEPTRLTLVPAALPKPSLQYQLLPDANKSEPGNAATLYYRSLAMFFENKHLLEDIRQEYWTKWLTVPLEDLRGKEVREKLGQWHHLLHEVEVASRRRQCDWQLDGRREGIGLVLPDLNGFRNLGLLLAVRARYEMATGRPDLAVRTLQTGFALARHLGEGPYVIHVLVGAAIANDMCGRLEELIQEPGASNLYWALTTLPRPFCDAQAAIRDQSDVFEHMFPWLKRLEEGALPLATVQGFMMDLERVRADFNIRKPELATLRTAALVTAFHGEAKRYLIDHGFASEMVEAMPSLQAVTLAAFREFRESAQEAAKWVHVRDGLRTAGFKEASTRGKAATARLDQLFFYGLLHGLQADDFDLEKLSAATGRVDRRLAALRCVESMRVYAAAHGGKLPASLADLVDAPAPDDPISGKPLAYKLAGETATLTTPPASSDKPGTVPAVEYELTVRH
jgi:hypothetical protein